jgi:outer membrane protein insertion porin family/translocation and assembly module TamA
MFARRRSRGCRLLAAAVALLVAPARATVVQSTDGAAPELRALHFIGAGPASRADLVAQLSTPEPPPWWQPWRELPRYEEGAAERDAEALERFYHTLGYFEARVAAVVLRDEAGRVEVRFDVEHGEPVRLAEIGIELPFAGRGALVADLPIAIGDVFSLAAYERAKKELLARLAEASYPLASVRGGADVDVPTHEARITWVVDPGPTVRFGRIDLHGLATVDEALVRREIRLQPGDPYTLSAQRETREGLQGLGLFRWVIVRPRPERGRADDGERIWPVEIALSERARRGVEVGVGWGTDDRLRGQLAYQHRNWLGDARLLDARLRLSRLERSARTSVEQPHWLAREQRLRIEGRLGQDLTPAYDAERVVLGVRATRQLGERWTVRAGPEVSWSAIDHTRELADRLLDDPEGAVFLSGLRVGATRSTVDDPLDAREGSWLDVSLASWLPALGSDFGFASAAVEGRVFHPLGESVVAARLRLATLEPFGSTSADDLPLTERFYAGGGSSVRGFKYWGLGPRQADGRPIGGASALEGSVELRFPIRGALTGAVFVDAGQVSLDTFGWRLDDVVYSTGIGFRYDTPIGPVRLDLAVPLNAPPDADTTFIHFSFGQAF